MGQLTSYVLDGKSLVSEVFIETGTFRGDTLALAAAERFQELHSCDVCEDYVEAARERFAGDERIHVHHGSSPDVLPRVIDRHKATTFWLDAHYQGTDRSEQDARHGECPLLRELAVIVSFKWRVPPIVLIDDAALFQQPWDKLHMERFRPEEWPTLDEILAALPGHYLTERENVLYFLPRVAAGSLF